MVQSLKADEQDIRYAYRLLLGREPDPAGLSHHRANMVNHGLQPREIADAFLRSTEYAALSGRNPIKVALEDYCLFVWPDDHDIGRHVASSGVYEPHVTARLRSMLRSGDVFVDVGANVGFFTALAAHVVGAHGAVIAVEPMEKNLQLIYRAIAANGWKQVRVLACAATDRHEIVRLASGPGTSNGQVIAADQGGAQEFYAQADRLDDLIGTLERIDLVKFDIEGFELHAWKGFERTLRRCRPTILSEFHPHCMRTYARCDPADYLAALLEYGRVSVLPREGEAIACVDAANIMAQWREADQRMGGGGTIHLDLLIEPET